MLRTIFIGLLVVVSAVVVAGQVTAPATGLGAHSSYGGGCTSCHTPHRGAELSKTAKARASSERGAILWGEDVTGSYEKTITSAGIKPAVLMAGNTPEDSGLLTCLSCHDGNIAQRPAMKERVYEKLPANYEISNSFLTLSDVRASFGNFVNERPQGLSAKTTCGDMPHWDCTERSGVIKVRGIISGRSATNFAHSRKSGVPGDGSGVICTTCHDPHAMNAVIAVGNPRADLPANTYATMFLARVANHTTDSNPMP